MEQVDIIKEMQKIIDCKNACQDQLKEVSKKSINKFENELQINIKDHIKKNNIDAKILSNIFIRENESTTQLRQIDHLLISSKGLLVIEAKNWKGTHIVCADEKNYLCNILNQVDSEFYQNRSSAYARKDLGLILSLSKYSKDIYNIKYYGNPINQVRSVSLSLCHYIKNLLNKNKNYTVKNVICFNTDNSNEYKFFDARNVNLEPIMNNSIVKLDDYTSICIGVNPMLEIVSNFNEKSNSDLFDNNDIDIIVKALSDFNSLPNGLEEISEYNTEEFLNNIIFQEE